jgi:hypothetical protein
LVRFELRDISAALYAARRRMSAPLRNGVMEEE